MWLSRRLGSARATLEHSRSATGLSHGLERKIFPQIYTDPHRQEEEIPQQPVVNDAAKERFTFLCDHSFCCAPVFIDTLQWTTSAKGA